MINGDTLSSSGLPRTSAIGAIFRTVVTSLVQGAGESYFERTMQSTISLAIGIHGVEHQNTKS